MTCAMCDMVHKEALALRATVAALTGSSRKIREIILRPEHGVMFAICEDGTLWYRGYNWEMDCEWVGYPPIPAGKISPKKEEPEPDYAPESGMSDLTDSDATMVHNVQMYQREGDYTGEGEK